MWSCLFGSIFTHSHDKLLSNAKGASKLADLVLVKAAKGLNKLEASAVLHALGKTATTIQSLVDLPNKTMVKKYVHVVVSLDGGRGALEGQTLNDIGVKGSPATVSNSNVKILVYM